MGVANDRSIAWGIASKVSEFGADLAFTYQGDALLKRVHPLAESVGSDMVMPCDVTDDASMDAVFAEIAEKWGRLDFLIHAIAYSDKEELKGKYVNTSRENFSRCLDISCYSFTALAQRAARLMTDGGSLLTLTYYGAERVMPHYNVMGVAKASLEACVRYLAVDLGKEGIRVNAISAGPVRTLSAAGVSGFKKMHRLFNEISPMQRPLTIDDLGNSAVYLCSEMSRGTTGEIHYVDGGYNIIGVPEAVDS